MLVIGGAGTWLARLPRRSPSDVRLLPPPSSLPPSSLHPPPSGGLDSSKSKGTHQHGDNATALAGYPAASAGVFLTSEMALFTEDYSTLVC